MKIKDTCCCGATFEAESKVPSSVLNCHFDWLKTHAPCREANMVKMAVELGHPNEKDHRQERR